VTTYKLTYVQGVYRLYRDDFSSSIPWFASPTKKAFFEYLDLAGISRRRIEGIEKVSERRNLYSRMTRPASEIWGYQIP
jgi:hypothetical protein